MIPTHFILLLVAGVCYTVVTFGLSDLLSGQQIESRKKWEGILVFAIAAHTLGLLIAAFVRKSLPIHSIAQISGLISLMFAIISLMALRSKDFSALSCLTTPIAAGLVCFSAWDAMRPESAASNVWSPWLAAHIASIVLGYASLLLASIISILYLLQSDNLKNKRNFKILSSMPPLERLGSISHKLIQMGYPLVIFGIVSGLSLANWHWSWDPKVVMVVCTGLLYTIYLAARSSGWQGRQVHYLLLVGLVLVIGSYLIPGEVHPL